MQEHQAVDLDLWNMSKFVSPFLELQNPSYEFNKF